jgi:hypothetical protein
MYAVIKSGGKQYRVKAGQTVRLEKLAGEAGSKVQLGDVLMVEDGGEVKTGACPMPRSRRRFSKRIVPTRSSFSRRSERSSIAGHAAIARVSRLSALRRFRSREFIHGS